MQRYEYHVVPFIGRIRGSEQASEVSKQLEALISQHADDGWEFYQIADVNIEVRPGCLAGLFGAETSYMKFDQVIFRMERDAAATGSAGVVAGAAAMTHQNSGAARSGSTSAGDAGPKGICPSCESVIPLNANECPKCDAAFGPDSAWTVKPVQR